MIELKRTVKKTVEEKYIAELKPSWRVRLLRPNGNRTYYVSYEQEFMYEPSEQEIASIIAEHSNYCNEFASVAKNYRLVELEEQKND